MWFQTINHKSMCNTLLSPQGDRCFWVNKNIAYGDQPKTDLIMRYLYYLLFDTLIQPAVYLHTIKA